MNDPEAIALLGEIRDLLRDQERMLQRHLERLEEMHERNHERSRQLYLEQAEASTVLYQQERQQDQQRSRKRDLIIWIVLAIAWVALVFFWRR
jgi:hypothetical protein